MSDNPSAGKSIKSMSLEEYIKEAAGDGLNALDEEDLLTDDIGELRFSPIPEENEDAKVENEDALLTSPPRTPPATPPPAPEPPTSSSTATPAPPQRKRIEIKFNDADKEMKEDDKPSADQSTQRPSKPLPALNQINANMFKRRTGAGTGGGGHQAPRRNLYGCNRQHDIGRQRHHNQQQQQPNPLQRSFNNIFVQMASLLKTGIGGGGGGFDARQHIVANQLVRATQGPPPPQQQQQRRPQQPWKHIPRYNMAVQKEISVMQKRPFAFTCGTNGRPAVVSFDGPGLETAVIPKATRMTMNYRFS